VAVCDAISPRLNPQSEIPNPQFRVGIKWPNDVLARGRKVCGILIESPGGAAPAKDRLVIGIGINVNNSWQRAPQDAGDDGVALTDLTGNEHDVTAVLKSVLAAIAVRIHQLRSGDPELTHSWQRLDLLAGMNVFVESAGRRIEGECREIADDGAILIATHFGQQRLYSGSVRPG
jgi:BirA family biotin operon repressor/biotin-[acetyl-CoA-carboxylase] ligase